MPGNKSRTPEEHQIQLELNTISQLFHSLDPSPFREKDLDDHAEEFIVSWVRELPGDAVLQLLIHLKNPPPAERGESAVTEAVRNYFSYRAARFARQRRELLKEGFKNLGIGLSFLAGCLVLSQALTRFGEGTLIVIVRESLVIGGWVAMWRPMQIFLYDRWPLKQSERLYQRLARMQVRLVYAEDTDQAGDAASEGSASRQ